MSINHGDRQVYQASPHLFALYIGMIMWSGIKLGGTVINNIRYAYDTVIIAESVSQLQELMDTMVDESKVKSLFLNSANSFTILFSKSDGVSA